MPLVVNYTHAHTQSSHEITSSITHVQLKGRGSQKIELIGHVAVVGHRPGLAMSGLDPGASVRVQRVGPVCEGDQQAREKAAGPHVDRRFFEEQVLHGGRNDATPASGHRLLNAENDAYGNESGNDLTPRHLTFITSPGGVLTVKWEQPVHASSLNELFSPVRARQHLPTTHSSIELMER